MDSPEGKSCKEDISSNSAEDSEEQDVANVLKELLPVHVVARVENDRRQDHVEESVAVEVDQIGELVVIVLVVDIRYQEA